MKRIWICVLMLTASSIFAQDFDLGVKGGVNYAESVILHTVGLSGVDMQDLQQQQGFGLVFGGFMRITAGKWIVEPEVLFSENGQLATLADADVQNANLGDVFATQFDKLDIPFLIGYNAFDRIRLVAGPVFSNYTTSDTDRLFDFDNLHMGYQLGFGFDVSRLAFDARYAGNLSRLHDTIDTGLETIQVDGKRNIFQFTVGYKIFD
ncbi:MAG: porin family protein [Chitinophagales bacterium]